MSGELEHQPSESKRWYIGLPEEDKLEADIQIHELLVDGKTVDQAIAIAYHDKAAL